MHRTSWIIVSIAVVAGILSSVTLVPVVVSGAVESVRPNAEQLIAGTSAGFGNLGSNDGSNWVGTEASAGTSTNNYDVSAQVLTAGTQTGGVFDACATASDDTRCTYNEDPVDVAQPDVFPATQELALGTTQTAGTFPTCLETDDNTHCVYQEGAANATDNASASSQTVLKGTHTSGTFPTCIETSDDTRCVYEEGDQGAATGFLDPDSRTVTIGTESGTFPGDLTSDNDVYVSVQEANQGVPLEIDVEVASFNTGTGTSTIDVVIGFQAEVIVVWMNRQTATSDAISTLSSRRAIGFGTSTTNRATVCSLSLAGSAAGGGYHGASNTAVLCSVNTDGTFEGLLDISAIDSDSVTFVPDDAFGASYRVHGLFLGGAAITGTAMGEVIEPTSTGAQDETGFGFQPEAVFFISAGGPNPSIDSTTMFGMASSPVVSDNPSDYVWLGASNEGSDPTQTMAYGRAGESIAFFDTGITATDARAEVDDWLADGFNLNWVETSAQFRLIQYLAIDGASWNLGDFLTSVTLDADITETGFGFAPEGALFISHANTQSTADTPQDNDEWSLGAFANSATDRAAMCIWDDDASATSRVVIAVEHDEVYCNIFDDGAGGSRDGLVDMQSVDADGFTLNQDDAETATNFVGYLAVGDLPVLDYELEYRVAWTTETCGGTRRLAVEAHITSAGGENVLLQVLDSTEVTYTTRITIVKTADDDVYQTYDLTSDEWDSGDPNVRFLGGTEAGDTTQSTIRIDDLEIRCIEAGDYEAEVKFSWTGVSTAGNEWRLFVEAREGAANPEQIDVKVYASDETALSSVVCSITSTTEAEYDCGALTTDQLDGGTPDILVVDNNQAGDTLQSTVEIDRLRIQRTFSFYQMSVEHEWSETLGPADSYTLRDRSLHSDAETQTVQLWDFEDEDWRTAYSITSLSETAHQASLVFACTGAADDCEVFGGIARVRIIGTVEDSTDLTQSTVSVDIEFIGLADVVEQLELKYSWGGVHTIRGTEWRLFVEARQGVTNPENVEVRVLGSDETTESGVVCTISSTTEAVYDCGTLTSDQLDGGNPDIIFRDANRASSDNLSSDLEIDRVHIRRTFNFYELDTVHKWQQTVTEGLAYELSIRAFMTEIDGIPGQEEAFLVSVYDWGLASFVDRITVNTESEEAYTYALATDDRASNGTVMVRWVGDDEASTDEVQSFVTADMEVIQIETEDVISTACWFILAFLLFLLVFFTALSFKMDNVAVLMVAGIMAFLTAFELWTCLPSIPLVVGFSSLGLILMAYPSLQIFREVRS